MQCELADDEKTLLAVDMGRNTVPNPIFKVKNHLLENVCSWKLIIVI